MAFLDKENMYMYAIVFAIVFLIGSAVAIADDGTSAERKAAHRVFEQWYLGGMIFTGLIAGASLTLKP